MEKSPTRSPWGWQPLVQPWSCQTCCCWLALTRRTDAYSSSGDCPSWSQTPPTLQPPFYYPGLGDQEHQYVPGLSSQKDDREVHIGQKLGKMREDSPRCHHRVRIVTVYYNAFSFPGAPQSPRDKVRIRAQAYGPEYHRAGQELGLEPEAPHNPGLKVLRSSPLLRSAPLTENFTCGNQVPLRTNLTLRTSLFLA